MKCLTSTCNKSAKPNKVNSTLCYSCYLDKKRFIGAGKLRMEQLRRRNINRHLNDWRNRNFECEMRYSDCEARGYCNGDC